MLIYNSHIVVLLVFTALLAVAVKAPHAARSKPRVQTVDASWLWQEMRPDELPQASANPPARSFRTLKLNRPALLARLAQAPLEAASLPSETVLPMPLPDGRFVNFQLAESSVLPPALAAKYPQLKSYRGTSDELPGALLRCDWSPRGLHVTLLWQDQWINIHPLAYDNADYYVSYDSSESSEATDALRCQVDERLHSLSPPESEMATAENIAVGPLRRTYRLALATTVEYTNHPALGSGSVATTMATLNTWVNALNVIYEKELSVRFVLAEANDQVIFTTEPDNLTAGENGKMLHESRAVFEQKLGLAKYDLGQVLSPGIGGVAFLGVVCRNDNYKGGGVTLVSASRPVGTGYGLLTLAHEVGHHFNAHHTFSDTIHPACNSAQFPPRTGYESFAGLTMMSYAETCTRIVRLMAPHFHSGSYEAISAFINHPTRGGGCAVTANTGNQAPTVDAGANYVIPWGTPFTLTAVGSDADAVDQANLTYSWEQLDAGTNPASTDGSVGPLFRPFAPSSNPARTFPSLAYILNNTNVPPVEVLGLRTAETLPSVARTLNFRCIVRDGRGGVNVGAVVLTVANAGPLLVTAPNNFTTWVGGTTQTVTWSVNQTNLAPINCQRVKISLSTDGGQSFPHVLAAAAPNTGSANVTVPSGLVTAQARLKIEAVGNIFFDISDADFTLLPGAGFGLEADVAARPNGNGNVSIADWAQLGRFVAGLDSISSSSELQRADCAPRATSGDGQITIADWVQAGRYAAGLDALALAADPTTLIRSQLTEAEAASPSSVQIKPGTMRRGQVNALRITATGKANALGFTVNFDPALFTLHRATTEPNVTLTLNNTQLAHGKLGVLLALPAGQTFPADETTVLALELIPRNGTADVTTRIGFSHQIVACAAADANAAPLPACAFNGADITIQGRAAAQVSAASFTQTSAATESIVSAFGTSLATVTQTANTLPLPSTLGGTTVRVRDEQGIEKVAQLFFVSPNQVNYLVPAGLSEGLATVTITNAAGEASRGLLTIARVAPGLFTADGSGRGYAAADVQQVRSDGSTAYNRVARFDPFANQFVANPIALPSLEQVFLILYGTGWRQRTAQTAVRATIGGLPAEVMFAGPQGRYAGLDQMNLRLPLGLAGRGEQTVEVEIDGQQTNSVRISLQ